MANISPMYDESGSFTGYSFQDAEGNPTGQMLTPAQIANVTSTDTGTWDAPSTAYTYTPPATPAPAPAAVTTPQSAGYTYASNNQGIDTYYNNINNFLANNPSPQQLADAMQQYGVSVEDIAKASGADVNHLNDFLSQATTTPTPAPAPAPVVQQPVVPTQTVPVYTGGYDNYNYAPPAATGAYDSVDFVNATPEPAPQATPVQQPVAPTPTATTTAPTTVADYRGTTYDTATLANLAKEVAQNMDLSKSSGGAYSTNKENIGFDYNTLSGAYGNAALTTGDQVAFDMARQLLDAGITDVSQLKNLKATTVNDTYSGEGGDYTVPRTAYIDPTTGKEVNLSFGNTFTGPGSTTYNIDPTTGKLYTTGASTSDFGGLSGILPVAALALNFIAPGIGSAIGEALGASGIGASMLGNAVIGGATSGLTGGNVLTGALTGAAGAGLSNVINPVVGEGLSNLTSGPVNPAVTNAVTGGLVSSALGGNALVGAATSGIGALSQGAVTPAGNTTYTSDDGSTITYDKSGNITGSTVSSDTPAPVFEYDPTSGTMKSMDAGGKLNILTAEQTAEIMNKVDPRLINTLTDTGTEPYRAEVSGLPGTAENPGYSKPALMTPGAHLATFDEIDAGKATWNPAANAWEIGADLTPQNENNTGLVDLSTPAAASNAGVVNTTQDTSTGNTTHTFDDGSTLVVDPGGNVVTTTPAGGGVSPTGTAATDTGLVNTSHDTATGNTTHTYDDGSTLVTDPGGNVVLVTPATGGGGGPVTPTEDNVPEITITAPKNPVEPPDVYTPPITDNTVTPVLVNPPVEPPVTPPVTPVVTPPVVVPPIIIPKPPVVTPPVTPTITTPTTPVVTPTTPAAQGRGLNPGWIQPTSFYNTRSPVQSKFFWGAHGYQAGPTFNAQAWNQAPAAETPWGLQAMDTGLTPTQVRDLITTGKYTPQAATPVASRVEAANPASMAAGPAYGQVYLKPAASTTAATIPATTAVSSSDSQYKQVAAVLGNDWAIRQQTAAQNGDWATYNAIQSQVNAILNPDTGGGGGA